VLVAGLLVLSPQRDARAADANIAIGSEATASSVENAGTPASAAVDGDSSTRWSSAWSDPQWLQLDLGAEADISGFTINWEAAFATAYHIEVSDDAAAWTQVYDTTAGVGGTTNITVPAGTSGRYVRLTRTAESNANLLVSVARDITQSAVVAHGASAMSKTAALTANAEHDLLVGNPTSAIAGLAEAWQTAQHD